MKKLITILLILTGFAVKAQYPTGIFIKPNNSFGGQMNRLVPDSTLYLPTACGVPTDTTWLFSQGTSLVHPGWGQKYPKAAVYYDSCGHHEYIWDPSLQAWHVADSIGGPGTTYTADEVSLHLTGSQFSIKSTYPGQSSITTLGTVTSGIWNSTAIADAYVASSANWNAKLGSTLNSAQIFVGNGSNVATGVSMSGAGSLSNTGAFSLTSTISAGSCTNCNLTYNAAGQLTIAGNGSGGSGGNPFADNTALVMNNADNSRLLIISAGSIATSTTRTLTAPNFNGIIATTNNAQTISGVQTLSSPPILTGLTGYVFGNGSSAITASSTIPTTALSGALQAAQEPAHTSDVTNTAGSLALTIAANAVTNAKAAQAPANTIKGNNTGSTANETDLTPAQVVAMMPTINLNVLRQGQPGDTPVAALSGNLMIAAIRDSLAFHHVINPDGSWTLYTPNAGTGTVTSAALTLPSFLSVTGTPITTSGTFTVTLATQSANTAFGNFTGSTAAPTFGKLPLAAMATNTANTLTGYDGSGNPTDVTAGTGITISGGVISSSGGGSPAGSNTQVQFNNSGAFGASSGMTWSGSVFTATAVTSTGDALIHGLNFGLGHSSVAHNTAGGLNALNANTTGDYQTGIGASALASETSGTWNTAVGGLAGFSATTGNYMVAVGQGACQNCNADYNVAIGVGALNTNTTHNDNTAVGGLALHSSDAYGNTAVGKWSFTLNTSGQHNTGIGLGAGSGVVSGNENFAGGYLALDLAVGNSSQNTAVGAYALQEAQGPQNNTVVGWDAAMQNTTLSDTNSIEIGSAAFGVIGTDHYRLNTIGIGNMIGYPLSTVTNTDATWSHCILAGDSLTNNSSIQYISNTTAIGHGLVIAKSNAFYLGTASQYFIIGNGGVTTTVRTAMANVAGSIVYDNTLGGFFYNNGSAWTQFASGSAGVTTVGTFSGSSQTDGASISGATITFGPADTTHPGMVTTGSQTIAGTKTFSNDLLINSGNIRVGKGVSSGTQNTGMGTTVFNTAGSYSGCTAVGFDVLFNNTGNQNTGVGANALIFNTSGVNNVAVGYEASDANTTGGNNTAVGWLALFAGQTFSNNTALGYQTLKANGASNNTAVGASTLIANTTGTYNDGIGTGALGALTVGNYNLGVGNLTANHLDSGSNNIYLGNFVDVINHKDQGIMRLGSGVVGVGHLTLTNASGAVDSSQAIGIGKIPAYNSGIDVFGKWGLNTDSVAYTAATTSTMTVLVADTNTSAGAAALKNGIIKRVPISALTSSTSPFFVSTANGSAYTSSTSSTALVGTGTGSGGGTTTVPSSSLTVGRVIHLHGSFVYSTGVANTNFTLLTSGAVSGISIALPISQTNAVCIWDVDVTIITTGSSGTCVFTGTLAFPGQTTNSAIVLENSTGTTTSSINTTSGVDFEPFGIWTTASASNSIQSTSGFTIKVQ